MIMLSEVASLSSRHSEQSNEFAGEKPNSRSAERYLPCLDQFHHNGVDGPLETLEHVLA